jgi:hypothetical protein
MCEHEISSYENPDIVFVDTEEVEVIFDEICEECNQLLGRERRTYTLSKIRGVKDDDN